MLADYEHLTTALMVTPHSSELLGDLRTAEAVVFCRFMYSHPDDESVREQSATRLTPNEFEQRVELLMQRTTFVEQGLPLYDFESEGENFSSFYAHIRFNKMPFEGELPEDDGRRMEW